ncbi:right-handed parallel beta-helix repeat-containing protein [Alteromonas sp. RKMC-009]|uniref:right-handed parallel beta-helix repeat-containing protein n=1 Tax=Alteromonas sp. RKMC-009 TaxID=2267264 RepID=UPI000E67FDEB|nr:right-handed parallel beta-helix repeat-containing protein [Alteromonas sp. RKMC-009]AYA63836.1 hypothetical protein DS731_07380 [Alteromonas sp. RKMC-009]
MPSAQKIQRSTAQINAINETATVVKQTLADAIAACLAGDVAVGNSVEWREYHANTGVGGNTGPLIDAGSPENRPDEMPGYISWVGDQGLYIESLFPSGAVMPEHFGWVQATGNTYLVDDSEFLNNADFVARTLNKSCDFGDFNRNYYLLNPFLFNNGTTIKANGAKFWRNPMFNGGGEALGATFRNENQVLGNTQMTMLGFFRFADLNDGTSGKTRPGKHIGLDGTGCDGFSYEKVQFDESHTFSTSISCNNVTLMNTILNHQDGAAGGDDGIHIRGGKRGYIGTVTGVSGDDCVAFTDEGDGRGADIEDWTVSSINADSRSAALFKVWIDPAGTHSIKNIEVLNISGKAGYNGKGIKLENATADRTLMSGISFKGRKLDCSQVTDNGIAVINGESISFGGFRITESLAAAVRITDCYDVQMDNVYIRDCKHDRNVHVENSQNIRINKGTDYNARGCGIIAFESTNVTVDGRTLRAFGSAAYRAWYSGNAVAVGERRLSSGKAYEASTAGTTGATAPTHTSGTVSDGGVNWLYLGTATNWGAGSVKSIGDIVVRNGRIYSAATSGTTGATAPTHKTGTASDGGVDWSFVDLYAGVSLRSATRSKVINCDIENGASTSVEERWSAVKNSIVNNSIPLGEVLTVSAGTVNRDNVA